MAHSSFIQPDDIIQCEKPKNGNAFLCGWRHVLGGIYRMSYYCQLMATHIKCGEIYNYLGKYSRFHWYDKWEKEQMFANNHNFVWNSKFPMKTK